MGLGAWDFGLYGSGYVDFWLSGLGILGVEVCEFGLWGYGSLGLGV